jgi:hypothetical protein
MAEIRKTLTIDLLSFRTRPGTGNTRLNTIPKNTEIEYIPIQTLSANGYNWVPVYYINQWGWCATSWLEAFQTKFIRTKWAGIHTIGNLTDNARHLITECKRLGKPVSAVLSVLDAGCLQWTKTVSPETKTILRIVWPDGYPLDNGRVKFKQRWFDDLVGPIMPFLSSIDFLQFINEKWPGNKAYGEAIQDIMYFYIDLMSACDRIGTHCTVLDLPPGNMADDRNAGEPDQFKMMLPMLKIAAAKGHALNYHMYNCFDSPYDPTYNQDSTSMRWLYWLQQIPGLKFIGGEALVGEWKDPSGQEAYLPDAGTTVKMIKTIDGMIEKAIQEGKISREQIIGYLPFTSNPGERWKNFNMEIVLPAQLQYLIS